MSLLILFDPEYITINSIPYALDADEKAAQPLSFGTPSRSCSVRTVGPQSKKKAQTRPAKSVTFDGSAELEDNVPTITTHQMTDAEARTLDSIITPKVHFQAPSLLQTATQQALLRARTSFNNPFSDEDASARRDSGSSTASDLVRPSAFLNHRDTLDRLYASTEEDDDETPQEVFLRRPQLYAHRDTLARLHFLQNGDVELPDHVLLHVAGYLSREEYENMRLVCRRWTEHLPRPKIVAAQRLPHEILVLILSRLLLPDFDAARHTCKSWFMASLDPKIATPVLRSSGGQNAYLHDLQHERQRHLERCLQLHTDDLEIDMDEPNQIDEVWLMSKRLATESRLSGH